MAQDQSTDGGAGGIAPGGRGRGVPIARRFVLRSPSRFAIAAGAATAVVVLVVLQLSIYYGVTRSMSWVERIGAAYWVVPEDAQFVGADRPVSDAVRDRVARVRGVRSVATVRFNICDVVPTGSAPKAATSISWPAGTFTLPTASGRMPGRLDEVAIDSGFAREHGIALGDGLEINRVGQRRIAKVVGTLQGASALIRQLVFITDTTDAALTSGDPEGLAGVTASAEGLGDLADKLAAAAASEKAAGLALRNLAGPIAGPVSQLLAAAEATQAAAEAAEKSQADVAALRDLVVPPQPGYLAVRLDRGADANRVADDMRAIRGVEILPTAEFHNRLNTSFFGSFLPVLYVVVGAAVVVGVLILGLTLSNMVAESVRDYAVLRAIGLGRSRIRRAVLGQGFYLVSVAFAAGILLGIAAGRGVVLLLPMIPVALEPVVFAVGAVAATLMGAIGSLLPIRRVQRIDPASVFRG